MNATVLDPLSSVRADARLALEGVAKNVATPVPNPEIPVDTGNPVTLVITPEAGVPRAGVTNVGEVANTNATEPVTSEITPANSAEVVAANCDRPLAVSASPVTAPVLLLTAVTLAAV